jgi:hypothetical protein
MYVLLLFIKRIEVALSSLFPVLLRSGSTFRDGIEVALLPSLKIPH